MTQQSAASPPDASAGQQAPAEARAKLPKAVVWSIVVGAVLIIAAAVTAAVFFVPQQAAPETTPAASGSPSAQESTEPEQTEAAPSIPATTVVPDCQTLHPAAQAATDSTVEQFGADAFNPPAGEVGRSEFDQQFGPVAQATADKAKQMRGCLYIFSFHDGLYQFVADISAADQAELVQALQADSDFVQSGVGPATMYAWGLENEGFGTQYTIHAFIGDVWIAAATSTDPATAIGPVIEAMTTANPHLTN